MRFLCINLSVTAEWDWAPEYGNGEKTVQLDEQMPRLKEKLNI